MGRISKDTCKSKDGEPFSPIASHLLSGVRLVIRIFYIAGKINCSVLLYIRSLISRNVPFLYQEWKKNIITAAKLNGNIE